MKEKQMKKKSNAGILLIVFFVMLVSLSLSNPRANIEQRSQIIKIGALGPLPLTIGQDMQKGAEMAVEEINSGDGVTVGATTYDFDLIIETTSSSSTGLPDVATGMASLTKLMDQDNVTALIGGFRPEVVVASQTVLDRPMIGLGSSAPIISPFFWRQGTCNATEFTRFLLDFYAFGLSGKGVQNVTIVREDAAWSLAMSNELHFYLQEFLPGNTPYNGYTQVAPQINFTNDIVITPTAALDSVVTSLIPLQYDYQGLNVNAIMHIFKGPVGRKVPQAWHILNLPQYLAGINVESQSNSFFVETEGACYGEIELELIAPDISSTNKTDAFRTAYIAKYGELPTYTSFVTYDAIYVLKDAMERANSLDVANLQTALALTNYNGASHMIRFTSEDNVWTHPIFGYPYGQVGYYDNGSRFVIVPGQEDVIVHDLYTTATIGVRGYPYMSGTFVQWQYGGVKKTIWGLGPGIDDDIGNLTIKLEWPIDHNDTGYIFPTTTTTTTIEPTTTITTTTTTNGVITANWGDVVDVVYWLYTDPGHNNAMEGQENILLDYMYLKQVETEPVPQHILDLFPDNVIELQTGYIQPFIDALIGIEENGEKDFVILEEDTPYNNGDLYYHVKLTRIRYDAVVEETSYPTSITTTTTTTTTSSGPTSTTETTTTTKSTTPVLTSSWSLHVILLSLLMILPMRKIKKNS
jgi:branched-chain amino acid transport system substrate-binding protein